MSETLVDRETEVAELRGLLAAGRRRMALLYGRRRVGKTFLLAHAFSRAEAFYYTAAHTTAEVNRRQLLENLARWSGRPVTAEDYPTWRSVFRLLLDFRAGERLVVILDEFQYLADDVGALASDLNAVWEERRAERPFLLVLSGSAVGTLEALDAGGAPLHGRLHWKHQLRPFDYYDAARMVPFRSLRDRVRAYGVFGGTPRYLAAVDARRPLAASVAAAALSPRGEVRIQVETALDQETGLREVSAYHAVLSAVAEGRTTFNEIAQRSGLEPDTGLRVRLERLMQLGFVEARRNLGARRREPWRYRLADPAFVFHYGFVARLEAELERGDAGRVYARWVAPGLDAHLGLVFERIAEQAYYRLAPRRKLPSVREWGRWEGKDRRGDPVELDIATLLTDGRVLTGAVKWNVRPVGPEVHARHVADVARLAESGVAWAHAAQRPDAPLLYVLAGGATEAFRRAVAAAGRPVEVWTLADLYGRGAARR